MKESGLLPIEETVQSQVQTYFPDVDSLSFVIGVSGGADSMALLHILHKLGIELHVVHINYQKRGIDSDRDAKLVKQAARGFGIDCKVAAVSMEESGGQNFQQWARDIRYRLFEEKAKQVDALGVVTAHHQDDQIETILQKIFRGSGLASWSGMKAWNGHLFRPLLSVSKHEITTYCEKQSIDFRVDSSNLESDFARNFLRNEWLANLEQHFPGWRKNILRIKEQAKIFESALSHILNDILDENNRIKRDEFLRLEKKLQKSVLVYYLHHLNSDLKVSRGALKELDKLRNLQTGKGLQLNDHVVLMRDRNFLEVVEITQPNGACCTLRKEEVQSGFKINGFQFNAKPYQNPDFKQSLYLDWDSIVWPLQLRLWKAGDQFQPLGMKGHQSVADHLTNRKVSATGKADVSVLEAPDGIIYAVLFPVKESKRTPGTIAEIVKCDESTNYCLTINYTS